MPNLVKASNQYSGQGLVIIGVNLQEGKGIIEPFARDFGINYPVAIDRTGSVGDKYHLLGLPTTYFVDRTGVIKSEYSGPFLENSNGTNVQGAIDVSELTKRIQEILAHDRSRSAEPACWSHLWRALFPACRRVPCRWCQLTSDI